MSDILPDSRCRDRRRGSIHSAEYGEMIQAYCGNCSAPHGYVPAGAAFTHVFVLCDDCYEKHGPPANAMRVPEDTFRQWEAEALAKEKRPLAVALDDPSSDVAKLKREFDRALSRGGW